LCQASHLSAARHAAESRKQQNRLSVSQNFVDARDGLIFPSPVMFSDAAANADRRNRCGRIVAHSGFLKSLEFLAYTRTMPVL